MAIKMLPIAGCSDAPAQAPGGIELYRAVDKASDTIDRTSSAAEQFYSLAF